jgi:hypothetical protein
MRTKKAFVIAAATALQKGMSVHLNHKGHFIGDSGDEGPAGFRQELNSSLFKQGPPLFQMFLV